MIHVTINGLTKQFEKGTSVKDIIEAFGDDVSQFTCAVTIGGKMYDLDYAVKKDCEIALLTFRDIKKQRELGQISAGDEEDADDEIPPISESAMEIFEDLGIDSVFSQEAIDAIESEIKSMVSGDLDEDSMTFEPRRALELLDSVADGTFLNPHDDAVYEAVSEAVYGENFGLPTLEEAADEGAEENEAEEESAEETETVEETVKTGEEEDAAGNTEETEPTGETEAAESTPESPVLTEISAEQLDAIMEISAAEAALNTENIDDLCDELISGMKEPVEPAATVPDWAAASVKSAAPAEKSSQHKESAKKKKKNKTGSHLVKAAAVLLAVGALGWFVGRTAIQALGSAEDTSQMPISRSDVGAATIVVSHSDVSASDLVPTYDAALLTFGSANELVAAVQTRLNELGYLESAQINGTYDKNTENAVSEFRKAHKINREGDIDSDTFALLFSSKVTAKTSEVTDAAATTVTTVPSTTTTTTAKPTTTTSRTTTRRTTTTTRRTTTTTGRTTTTRRTITTTGRTTTTTTITEPTTTTTTAVPTSAPTTTTITAEPTVTTTNAAPTSAPTTSGNEEEPTVALG